MPEPTSNVSWRQFAEILSVMPDVFRKLRAEHVAAGCGRCRACTVPGTGTPGVAWPCPMRKMADLARDIHAARSTIPRSE